MANSYEAVGRLHAVMDVQQVTDTFKKREFVLEVQDGNYPQQIKFQVTQDRCALIDNYKVGQEVKVMFNLRGREFTNKEGQVMYFTNLEAWRLEAAQSSPSANTDYSQIKPAVAEGNGTDFDDIPF
ncbi:MAG: DUF3127 domain-containing protein [Ignavibacteria bacterium]|nr:DUF3127 domain-containing protein [Ignavibacteria bacterium]